MASSVFKNFIWTVVQVVLRNGDTMARKIFYSWQGTLLNATNRGFIAKALEGACTVVGQDLSVDERPEVDRDTQGVPGAPDIADTIFAKIDSASCWSSWRPCPESSSRRWT